MAGKKHAEKHPRCPKLQNAPRVCCAKPHVCPPWIEGKKLLQKHRCQLSCNTTFWGKQMVGELSNLLIAKSLCHKTVFTSWYQTTFKQEQKVTFPTLLVNCSHLCKRAVQSPYAHDSAAITGFMFYTRNSASQTTVRLAHPMQLH